MSPGTFSAVYTYEPTRLEVTNRPNLVELEMDASDSWGLSSVFIDDVPKLISTLKFSDLQSIKVTNAPQVQSIAIDGILPRRHEFQGLGGLQNFAVGGPEVTGKTLAAIKGNDGLNTLTLAYPSIPAEDFRLVADFPALVHLHLPGAALTDEVVANWPTRSVLSTVDVSKTQLTAAGLKQVLGDSIYLMELSIADCPIAADELRFLSRFDQLTRLDLGGVGISPLALAAILQDQTLTHLDLSKAKLDAKLLGTIARIGGSVKYLALRECEVDSDELLKLAYAQPQIFFDISGSDTESRVMAWLVQNRRISEVQEWAMHEAYRNNGGQMRFGQTVSINDLIPSPSSLIDTKRIAERIERIEEMKMRQSQPELFAGPDEFEAGFNQPVAPSNPIVVSPSGLAYAFGQWLANGTKKSAPPDDQGSVPIDGLVEIDESQVQTDVGDETLESRVEMTEDGDEGEENHDEE